jgi:hypothetical protein
MMIMDAGVHVWWPQAPDRHWMPGRKAHLPEPLTYEKFGAMMKGAGVAHGTRRKANDEMHRPCRISVSECGARRSRNCGSSGS